MGVLTVLLYIVGGLLGLVVGAALCLAGWLKYKRSKYSHLPTPKLPPGIMGFVFGHAKYIQNKQESSKNDEDPAYELYNEWYEELNCPDVFAVFMFHMTLVVVAKPEHVKSVIMDVGNSKPSPRDNGGELFGERLFGNGLVTIPNYEQWKPRRKIYDHSFNKGYLKTLLPSFNECTDKLLEGIRPLADGKTRVPMKQHLAEVTLNVISKVAFGSDFSDQLDDKSLGLKWAKGNGNLTFLVAHTFKGVEKEFYSNPIFKYLHPFEVRGYREAARAIRRIGRDCILKRIKAVEAGEPVPKDILSSMLQVASTKEIVEIEDLVDDFYTFYAAGQETTSNLLSFTMVLIHQHPDVLTRLQAEVDEVLEGRTEVTNDDLDKLQYTEQVLMESLRMYSPASGIAKEAKKGGLQFGEHKVPEGSLLFLATIMMCRMPEYFDNPDEYDPSRFNPENKQPNSFVYFPFGLGHRSCIGKQFAMMEAKLILARLVQTFRFTLPPDYKLEIAERITIQPKGDVPCTVTQVNET